jgi:hypothetical protein
MEEYRLAVDVETVRGESELRGRDLSAGELRGVLEACARALQEVLHPPGLSDGAPARCRLPERALRVHPGKGRKPRLVSLPASAVPSSRTG